MSWLSKLTGADARRGRRQAAEQRLDGIMEEERSGQGWKAAFNDTAGSLISSQIPNLLRSLQGGRESAIARGISTGDLGTSYEGDLMSAFQRNLANVLGGLSMQGYENSRNRYLDLAAGKFTAASDAEMNGQNFFGSLLGGGMGVLGDWLGNRGGKQ